eukprot:455417-Amphidinium_carterae.3
MPKQLKRDIVGNDWADKFASLAALEHGPMPHPDQTYFEQRVKDMPSRIKENAPHSNIDGYYRVSIRQGFASDTTGLGNEMLSTIAGFPSVSFVIVASGLGSDTNLTPACAAFNGWFCGIFAPKSTKQELSSPPKSTKDRHFVVQANLGFAPGDVDRDDGPKSSLRT